MREGRAYAARARRTTKLVPCDVAGFRGEKNGGFEFCACLDCNLFVFGSMFWPIEALSRGVVMFIVLLCFWRVFWFWGLNYDAFSVGRLYVSNNV